MKRRAAACVGLLLLCGCAVKPPSREPSIVAVRVTFRGHMSVIRNCQSRGVAPTVEAAEAAGANLALVFAAPTPPAPGGPSPQRPGEDATWVPFGAKPAGIAGVRAFKCPDDFVDNIVARRKRPPEVAK